MARVEHMMSQHTDSQQHGHSHHMTVPPPPELSFYRNGEYSDRKQIEKLREKHGYCRTCPGDPIQLYDIGKNDMTPSWSSRRARTVEGESFVGTCLKCHPDLDPQNFSEKKPRAPFHRPEDGTISEKDWHSSKMPPGKQRFSWTGHPGTTNASFSHLALLNPPSSSSAAASAAASASASPPISAHASAPTGMSLSPSDALQPGGDEMLYNDHDGDYNDRKQAARRQTSNPLDRSISSKKWSGRDESLFDDVDEYIDMLECVYEERRGSMYVKSNRKLATCEEKSLEESTAIELELLLVDLLQSGDADVTLNVLLDGMRSYPTASVVQKLCLRVLGGLAKNNESNKELIVKSDASELILDSMKRLVYEDDIQEEGCRLLWSLALCKNNIVPLIKDGAVPRIMRSMVEKMTDERLVHVALGALRALSTQMVRHSFVPLHGKNLILQIMETHSTLSFVQRDGILILANISIDKVNRHVAVASKEELNAIIGAMNHHARETSVMSVISVACFALKNYTYEENNLRALSKEKSVMPCLKNAIEFAEDRDCRKDAHDVFDRIRKFISEESERNKSSAISAVRAADSSVNLSQTDGDDDGPVFHTELSPNEVFSLMLQHANSTRVAEDGLNTLLLQVNESPRTLFAMMSSGAPRKVVAVMTHHDCIPNVQESGCKLLKCLAGSTYDDRSVLRNAGAVNAIMVSMEEQFYGNEGVQIAAFRALNVLAVDFECWFELMQSDSMSVIEQAFAIHMGIPDLEIEGFELLQKLSAHSD
mmetsp:Transcript_5642/g.8017  ORF Transcript_5642/g.8017 Transcript_5642/m.8017 type:complete len:766 (+) Transcript_5642:215-2512(+)